MQTFRRSISDLLLREAVICALVAFFAAPQATKAECGGYVTIGNKAKLKELQAKGYLPVQMNSDHSDHKGTQNSGQTAAKSKFDGKLKVASEEFKSHKQDVSESEDSQPTPCSGTKCRSRNRSRSMPTEYVPTVVVGKPAVGSKASKLTNDKYSGFVGYSSFNQIPFGIKRGVDRPPE